MKRYCLLIVALAALLFLSCNQNRQAKSNKGSKRYTQPPYIHARPAAIDTGYNKRQFAYIKNLQQKNGKWICTADYIEFYMGDKAVQVAKKRGDATADTGANGKITYFVYNDYYIVNDSKQLQSLAVSPAVVIKLVDFSGGQLKMRNSSFDELLNLKHRDSYPFILGISAGVIKSIIQQYVP